MRIMHISANIFPSLGEETSTKAIWRELARDADEYHVVGRSSDQHPTKEQEGNIILHRLPRLFRSSASLFLESASIIRLVKKHKINIILAQSALFGGVQAIVCKMLFGTRVLVEVHGDHYFAWMSSPKGKAFFLDKVIRWVYRNADIVRVLNERMLEMFHDLKVIGNFEIIYNRVNLDIFSRPKSDFSFTSEKVSIMSVGSFVERKGYRFVIEALGKSGYAKRVKLILVGGGEQKKLYRRLAEQYKIEIDLYDRIPQNDFVNRLYNADIYIQPSYSEAVPRAIIEAMAMRLPILASDVGMIRGLLSDRVNGLLFSKGNEEEFLSCLDLLLENKALRKELATNAYRDALDKYEWNRCFDRYRKALYSLYKVADSR